MFPGRGPSGPYSRLAQFPDLATFLDRHYTITLEGTSYRIYARRPAPDGTPTPRLR